MRAGVDIDGTISTMPEVFRAICRSLVACGHHVYIVTAAMPGHPSKDTRAGRQVELAGYGMHLGTHYDAICLARGEDRTEVAKAKAALCRELHLDVMCDNDPLNVAACREVTNVLVPAGKDR